MRVIISGGGNTMEYLAAALLKKKHIVTVIEEDVENVDRLSEVLPSRVTIVQGDGCNPEIQRDAGMGSADMFISLTSHDETNLVACELAKINFNVPRCISTVSSPKNMPIFRKLGIESVSSTEIIARMVEEEAVMGDMRMVFSLREGDIIMVEKRLPARMKHAEGIMVRDLPPLRYAQLIAVVRDDDFVMINADTMLMPGETIIVATKSDAEDELHDVIKHL